MNAQLRSGCEHLRELGDISGNSFHPKNMESGGGAEEPSLELPWASQTLKLFPNPAKGFLSVYCEGVAETGIAHVRLFDAAGRQVLDSSMRGPLKQLDVTSLNGLYIVLLDTENARFTGRVIIQ